jgi:hypothetical protein
MVPDLDNMRPEAAAYLALIAMMQAHSTSATTPAPPDMTVHVTAADLEAQHDQLRAAPVHVQALILDDPAEVLRFGRCTVDASVIRSFKGWEILPVGSLFRLTIPCDPAQNGRVWRARDAVHEGRVFRRELTRGRIIEAYLDHFGPRLGYRLAGFPTEGSTAPEERYVFLSAASLQPRLPVPPTGNPSGKLHFWVSGRLLEQVAERVLHGLPLAAPAPDYPALTLDPAGFEDRGQERPPAFPTRYVAQTITHPDRPGLEYRVLYDPDTWRTRVDELDATGKPTSLVQYGDALADMMFQADTKAHTLSKIFDNGGQHGESWLGTGLLGLSPILQSWQLQREGSKVIANAQCTSYHIVQERWNPHGFLDEGHICLTDNGLALETNDVFFGPRPYVTIKVEYPEHVDASEFDVPEGWPVVEK